MFQRNTYSLFGARRVLTLAATLAVALAIALPASAGGGPGEAAAGGCALQCIEKALVTATASSAKVEIVTSVPTKVKVTARKLPTPFLGPVDASATGPSLNTKRALFLYGLQQKSTYRITVSATDASGRTATRSGTFRRARWRRPSTRAPAGSRPGSAAPQVHHEGDAGFRSGPDARCSSRDQHRREDHVDREYPRHGIDRRHRDQPVDHEVHVGGLAAQSRNEVRPRRPRDGR